MKTFTIIGSSGYIAQRHISTIRNLGHQIVAIIDPKVRLIPEFPDAKQFRGIGQFMQYCSKSGFQSDYLVVCSPSFLHPEHCKSGFAHGMNVICEKPVSFTVEELELLQDWEKAFNRKIYPIMQLRYLKSINDLIYKLRNNEDYVINVTYNAPRNDAYFKTWKGDFEQSGGFVMNLGIHFFDLAYLIFGYPLKHQWEFTPLNQSIYGFMSGEKWAFSYGLSTHLELAPKRVMAVTSSSEVTTISLSEDPELLYQRAYQNILSGAGLSLEDVKPAISICQEINEDLKQRMEESK